MPEASGDTYPSALARRRRFFALNMPLRRLARAPVRGRRCGALFICKSSVAALATRGLDGRPSKRSADPWDGPRPVRLVIRGIAIGRRSDQGDRRRAAGVIVIVIVVIRLMNSRPFQETGDTAV